jgi:hypothetical protein
MPTIAVTTRQLHHSMGHDQGTLAIEANNETYAGKQLENARPANSFSNIDGSARSRDQ